MLRTRLIVGPLLAAAAAAMLLLDVAPWFPLLLAGVSLLGVLAAGEFVRLIPPPGRPRLVVTTVGVVGVLLANWYGPLAEAFPALPATGSPWPPVAAAVGFACLLALLAEMAAFTDPGGCVARVAHTTLAAVYLSLLASGLVRLRWLDPDNAILMMALAVFVPKACDIGAYFTGRFLGRHPFTPRLSPKKTWEGVAGGLVASAGVAVGLSFAGPVFRHGIPEAVAFGVVVGFAGILGDLAESLIKRDGGSKDASNTVPGFGGVLDVVDAILFAGPVAYLWFAR